MSTEYGQGMGFDSIDMSSIIRERSEEASLRNEVELPRIEKIDTSKVSVDEEPSSD